jgi:hypothetical protein
MSSVGLRLPVHSELSQSNGSAMTPPGASIVKIAVSREDAAFR